MKKHFQPSPQLTVQLKHYWQFVVAALAALIGLGLMFVGWHTAENWLLGVVSIFLCLPLLYGMWDTIQHGSFGVNILALTAIITSVCLQQYWAAIVICLMLMVGQGLEDYAVHKSRNELKALLAHEPQQAHVLRGRKVVDVLASSLRPGDKIVVKAGEVVPVDAIIFEDSSSFDESSLTGESLLAAHGVNDQIVSGSVNQGGNVSAKAIHSVADSQYQQILELVKNVDARQSPFVRLAERYSIPFTLAAFTIAGTVWYTSHHAIRFLEVIVVATPYPLLLAAPIALISGMSRASRRGIIVRTAATMEKLAEARTFAFDKTGTLTLGQPTVDAIVAVAPYTKNEVLTMAASLEQASPHILAQAIIREASDKHLSYTKAKHVSETSGQGVRASFRGQDILVGQESLLATHGVVIPAKLQAKQTASYVAIGGKLVGIITFKDEVRPETKGMLAKLKQLKIKELLMVTGNTKTSAQAVAKQLGIKRVYAAMTPGDKLRTIEQVERRPVAFVGNGVNDAPILTAADIGIALGARGSTAASESADVIIMPDDIGHVAEAATIARRTFHIAKQSILIGILLSLVLMGAFATGKFPPLLGAVLQEVVCVFVIFNALRTYRS